MTPSTAGGVVVCECGSLMSPEVMHDLDRDRAAAWLYWRCHVYGHITAAVPLPAALEHPL